MFQRSFRRHLERVRSGAASDLFDGVPRGLEEDDVDFVEEDARQHAEAGCEYSDDLHRRNELAVSTEVCRDERDPNDEEYEHAESNELGLCEVFRKLPRFKREEETNGRQEARVADEKPKGHNRTFVACDENDLVDVVVPVAGGRRVVKPDHTDHDLDKRAQKHQKKL